MNRTEFEALRDISGKIIREHIRFSKRAATRPALTVEDVPIENDEGIDLRLNITYNPEVGSKTFNVHVQGVGPICRFDVDGPVHHPVGRSHKHAVQTERCPDRNLPEQVDDRPDLSGKPLRVIFDVLCQAGQITHSGSFNAPDEGQEGDGETTAEEKARVS